MADFVVLWPYLLTTKLSCLQKNNFGHTKSRVWITKYLIIIVSKKYISTVINVHTYIHILTIFL